MAINELKIDGRLTRDAEVKHTSSGARVIKFSLAQTERKKQGDSWVDDGASFYDVEYWSHDHDDITKFSKGQYISFIGKIRQDRWEKDGKQNSKVRIIMREIVGWDFVNKSSTNNGNKPDFVNPPSVTSFGGGFSNRFEDDIPFSCHWC